MSIVKDLTSERAEVERDNAILSEPPPHTPALLGFEVRNGHVITADGEMIAISPMLLCCLDGVEAALGPRVGCRSPDEVFLSAYAYAETRVGCRSPDEVYLSAYAYAENSDQFDNMDGLDDTLDFVIELGWAGRHGDEYRRLFDKIRAGGRRRPIVIDISNRTRPGGGPARNGRRRSR